MAQDKRAPRRDPDDVIGQYIAAPGDRGPKVAYEIGTSWFRVTYKSRERWTRYPPGLGWWIPNRFEVHIDDAVRLPNDLVFQFVVVDGKPHCENLMIQGTKTWRGNAPDVHKSDVAPITGKALREVPVGELMQVAVLAAVASRPATGTRPADHPRLEDWASLYAAGDLSHSPRRPGKRLPDEHYRVVAHLYQHAVSAGVRNPNQEMALASNSGRSTVARWVQESRRRGLLGPAIPGRAGEGEI